MKRKKGRVLKKDSSDCSMDLDRRSGKEGAWSEGDVELDLFFFKGIIVIILLCIIFCPFKTLWRQYFRSYSDDTLASFF